MPTKSSMEPLPSSPDSALLPARFVVAKARLEPRAQQIFDLLAARPDITDEDLELIEIRYQQTLALMNLQDLFAEGQFDSM